MPRSIPVCIFSAWFLTGCGDDASPPTPPDTTPPASVESLRLVSSVSDAVTLRWTAPGDDGGDGQAARYEVRYSLEFISEANWDSAAVAVAPPVPKRAGQAETFGIADLAPGIWYFGLRAADEVPNWSAVSNIIAATVVGDVPPSAVTDLEVVSEDVNTIVLRWTAPGGDARIGTAAAYDLRHSLTPIDEKSWESATVAPGVPAPNSAGNTETFSVTGLVRNQTYFFALESIDTSDQRSGLSNVVSARTRSLIRLTSSPHSFGTSSPDWSPDGKRIAFVADWQQQFYREVYVMPSAGGAPRRLTNLEEGAKNPRWSPDGRRLAIGVKRPFGSETREEISILNVDGGGEMTLVSSLGSSVTLNALSWSPDGTMLACAITDRLVSGAQIYLVDASGGNPLLLAGGAGAFGLDWSPDGTRIVFASIEPGSYGIWMLPAGGGVPTRLTTSSTPDFAPSWSPDGERIAFTSSRGGTQDIWVMSATGENLTQLTSEPGDELSQTWSPDGERIAFNRVSDQIYDIWVLYLEPPGALNSAGSTSPTIR